jgi:alpha-galactosidase
MLIYNRHLPNPEELKMNHPTKIVCIGAGSYSFGLTTLVSLLRSPTLKGSELVLVDRNETHLDTMLKLVEWLDGVWDSQMKLSAHTHHHEALEGAKFVINAIEVGDREALWESDFLIPLKHGVRQPYAENGGPGGFAHAARNIIPILEIAWDMENLCPDALFINFTNPMQRICAAVHRHSKIKVVGLCHQLGAGYAMVGKALADDLDFTIPPSFTSTHASPEYIPGMQDASLQAVEKVKITAAGVNHFTWMLALRDRQTGEDLYPLFRKRWDELPEMFEPLTRRVFNTFGLFPIPGDEHLCEYLPWVSDPTTKPWKKFEVELYEWQQHSREREENWDDLNKALQLKSNPEKFVPDYSEGALEVIENIQKDSDFLWEAVNVPNKGQVPNLPEGAIIELPGLLNADGVMGVHVGVMPDGIAELLRREITVSHLTADAVVQGDRRLALQALLLDPVIRDMDTADQILEDYLRTYKQYLPTFWG